MNELEYNIKTKNRFRGLNETQRAVIETIRMRLTEKEALAYLASNDVGFPMSRQTYYRVKKKVNDLKLKRLYNIASVGFEDQHIERIDQLEIIQKLMWSEYRACTSPYQRVLILEKIANVQPLLSAYYDATKEIMNNRMIEQEQQAEEYKSNSNDSLPPPIL